MKYQKHGLRNHPLYNVWSDIKKRCLNKNNKDYKNYGARGISIHDDWIDDFKSFYNWAIKNGYSAGLSIDRKDNDLGYAPNNCKFSTPIEQIHNRRKLKTNSCGYTGVWEDKTKRAWRAVLINNGKRIYIGTHKTALSAAIARDDYILENSLPHRLNVKKG